MVHRPSASASLSSAALRSLWCRHQQLGADLPPQVRAVLRQMGWVRTLGGVDAYLAIHARSPRLRASDLHAALAEREVEVVPAARGCVYLVARDDAPLARALARDLTARRSARDLTKAGVSESEMVTTRAAILSILESAPATTRQLRQQLTGRDGAIRALGAAGKKVGLSSTLPPALRQLELSGRIYRRPVDDRLTHETYRWHPVGSGDRPTVDPRPPAQRHAELLRRMLDWLAPMTVAQLSAFSGLGKRLVAQALAGEDIAWVTAEGVSAPLALRRPQLATLDAPAPSTPAFLPGLDSLFAAHGGPGPFVAAADRHRPVAPWGRPRDATWGGVQHALSRSILVNGRIGGTWEADPDGRRIVVAPFSPGLPPSLSADSVRRLLWDQLDSAAAFSIDTPTRLLQRLHLVRTTCP